MPFQNWKLSALSKFLPLLVLFLTSESFAKVTGLINWQENGANVILPKIEGKNTKTIPQLYKNALEHSVSYKTFSPFFGKEGKIAEQFETGSLSDLPELKTPHDTVPFAFFANSPKLMNSTDKPFQNFKKSLGAAGAAFYVIPFGIDTLLTDKEDLKTYFDLISKQFPALISPGGEDIDPSLYGERNTFSVDLNLTRDKVEMQLIRNFVNTGQGVFYGICRGHQAYAVATGGLLIQDLPVQLSPNVIHRPTKNPDGSFTSSWHSIILNGKDNALFQAVEKESILVNSRHHQAVKSIPPTSGDVIALAGGNVIEAIEKRDSQGQVKVLTLQFHPENDEMPDGDKIIKLMVDQARQTRHMDTKSDKTIKSN
ncbi:MAG: gamma-glutamyl-gamma-aminobutyrate hydrolase family protein [Bdellovibrionia bacterium]